MRILVIDNYDSFTYNLVYLVRDLDFGKKMDIVRNDRFALDDVERYSHILLSPGPGIPSEAGLMMDVIREYGPTKRILGICLGHQGIGEAYGATLRNLDRVLHGIQGTAYLKSGVPLFEGLPASLKIAHYHSWVVDTGNFPEELEITAEDPSGLIMGLAHKKYDVQGLQFHPESILTEHGREIMQNWLKK